MWVSLLGFFLCVIIMFLIDWKTSLITFAVFFILYIWVVYRKPGMTQFPHYKRPNFIQKNNVLIRTLNGNNFNFRRQLGLFNGSTSL